MDHSSQSFPWMPLLIALIALAGVALGSYLTARYTFKNQLFVTTYQSRQQSYSAIMGKNFLRNQLYVSRFEALIYSDYHEYLWRLAGSPATSIDFEEAKRWMHKSEDFAIEIARTNQTLFESIGMARASFPATDELEKLTEKVYRFGSPRIEPPAVQSNRAALDAWKTKAVKDLQELVRNEYGAPIDALLEYLKPHINDPVSF